MLHGIFGYLKIPLSIQIYTYVEIRMVCAHSGCITGYQIRKSREISGSPLRSEKNIYTLGSKQAEAITCTEFEIDQHVRLIPTWIRLPSRANRFPIPFNAQLTTGAFTSFKKPPSASSTTAVLLFIHLPDFRPAETSTESSRTYPVGRWLNINELDHHGYRVLKGRRQFVYSIGQFNMLRTQNPQRRFPEGCSSPFGVLKRRRVESTGVRDLAGCSRARACESALVHAQRTLGNTYGIKDPAKRRAINHACDNRCGGDVEGSELMTLRSLGATNELHTVQTTSSTYPHPTCIRLHKAMHRSLQHDDDGLDSTHQLTHACTPWKRAHRKKIRRDTVWDDPVQGRRYVVISSGTTRYFKDPTHYDSQCHPQDSPSHSDYPKMDFSDPLELAPASMRLPSLDAHHRHARCKTSQATTSLTGIRSVVISRSRSENRSQQLIETRIISVGTSDFTTIATHDARPADPLASRHRSRELDPLRIREPARPLGRHHRINRRFRGLEMSRGDTVQLGRQPRTWAARRS
ncbi:hypothetical protein DFP72DRAFT_844204 [Ephemerocybe angulata]|uniref:Uncharacterized protein n=1 Tax=Ephemerocybe angulata TaxID=980116 RepID=A0A8H6I6F9_9AGAR|nr:hypothetical protein DFP72DRAFT_844204 [Tulosesus angulatus]